MPDKIQFLEYQKPSLEAGRYKVSVTQVLKLPGQDGKAFSSDAFHFVVAGERFTLDPASVHALHPPAGSLGNYTDSLPHIAIKRSTFPWERSAYGKEDFEPWVALLLFDEEEVKQGDVSESKTLTLQELKQGNDAEFPHLELEPGQSDEDKVRVIDVRKGLLDQLMPSGDELKLLTHVRRRIVEDAHAPEIELALVMANRLPKEGSSSVMHLVSLEGRLNEEGIFNSDAAPEALVRLVSLKSWSFACPQDVGKNFEQLVESLSTGVLRLPSPERGDLAETYLSRGYVPLPHTLRQSDKTYSWYHGPLSTHAIPPKFTTTDALPAFGDALLRYHQDLGMFDVSYAAAFELGRALALEDSLVSTALYQWKHKHNERMALELQREQVDKLMGAEGTPGTGGDMDVLEEKIKAWFTRLARLYDIPFNYLVPDERLLPPESVRFFKIDRHWIESLLYGAFTIGGTIRKRKEGGHGASVLFNQLTEDLLASDRSGLMLRSELVADYPDLLVDAYAEKIDGTAPLPAELEKLNGLRIERVGYDTLLCLFEGTVRTAELYLKPEGLRFGLDEEMAQDGSGMTYEKDIDKKIADGVYQKVTIPLPGILKDTEKRIVRISTPENEGIADRIREALEQTSLNSAQFGMHMLEGSSKGRFVVAG